MTAHYMSKKKAFGIRTQPRTFTLAGQQDEEKVSGLEEKTAAGQTGGDAKEAGLGVTEGSDTTGLAS
ncbi:hypothetical protein SRHO_G00128930 [Serrasalmus rhombeus]